METKDFKWGELSWEDLQKKIRERVAIKYPRLIRIDNWFNTEQQADETYAAFVRRMHQLMFVNYLTDGLDKNQLLTQVCITKCNNNELREEIVKHFKDQSKIDIDAFITFIETTKSLKRASGPINLQKGAKKRLQSQIKRAPNPNATCKICNRDKPTKHLKENCKAK